MNISKKTEHVNFESKIIYKKKKRLQLIIPIIPILQNQSAICPQIIYNFGLVKRKPSTLHYFHRFMQK